LAISTSNRKQEGFELFSVMYSIALLLLVREKNSPLIYGPVWFSLSLASKSPDEPRIVTSPSEEVLLNSYAPTKMIPAGDTATAVGPNLPENW
jgi:hypothetical protein